MSQKPKLGSDTIGEQINGFEQLKPRQIHGHEYRVLSWRNGSLTAHKVDVEDMTCTCDDMGWNHEGQGVCDHIAVALFEAPKRIEISDTAPFYLSEAVDEAQTAAETAKDVAANLDKAMIQARDATAQAAADEPADKPTDEPAVVGRDDVEEWLQAGYMSPDKVDIRLGAHGRQDGIVLEPDSTSMNDAEKDTFKSLVKTLEDSNCHAGFLDDGCGQCGESDDEYYWFIPETDSSEVWS